MNSDLAYLCGVYLGDGHVDYRKTKNGTSYQFWVVGEDEDLCELASSICKHNFNCNSNISKVGNYFRLRICSKEICTYLLNLFCSNKDYFLASNIEKKSTLPVFSSEDTKSFIQGLMDSDGWISKRKNGKYTKFEVGFKNTSLLSPQLYDLMLGYGLKCNKINYKESQSIQRNHKLSTHKAYWTWTINTEDYINRANFRIGRKSQLCQEYFDYKKQHTTRLSRV